MSHSRIIRSAEQFDDDAIWRVIEPVFRAGETYPLPRDISRADAFASWRASGSEVFVAEDGGRIVGTYYLLARQQSRWRQPRCELRLYCRGKCQSTRGGTGDVRTFAGASARAWLHRITGDDATRDRGRGNKPERLSTRTVQRHLTALSTLWTDAMRIMEAPMVLQAR
jgi:hypothetical protein